MESKDTAMGRQQLQLSEGDADATRAARPPIPSAGDGNAGRLGGGGSTPLPLRPKADEERTEERVKAMTRLRSLGGEGLHESPGFHGLGIDVGQVTVLETFDDERAMAEAALL